MNLTKPLLGAAGIALVAAVLFVPSESQATTVPRTVYAEEFGFIT